MASGKRRTGLLAVVVIALIALGVAFFALRSGTSDEAPNSPGSPDSAGSPTAAESTGPSAADLNEQYLASAPPEAEGVAVEQGTVYGPPKGGFGDPSKHPGTLRVLEVSAGRSSTHVRFSLSADEEVQLNTKPYVKVASAAVQEFELVAESADLRLRSGRWASPNKVFGDCVCAWLPATVGPRGWS